MEKEEEEEGRKREKKGGFPDRLLQNKRPFHLF